MKVLVIDDEAHIRKMMRLTLEASGYEVDEATTGQEGIERFTHGRYAAAILDQKMPGLDGLQTLQRIREKMPDACVLMVTAFASIELAVDAMRLGATDFLRKPMTPEALRAAVAAAIAGGRRPTGRAAPPGRDTKPQIETLTLNGFQILGAPGDPDPARAEHVFHVTHFPDRTQVKVIITIDPEAVARVARLTRRHLQPGGAFWRLQAERLLSAFVWSEGKVPEKGQLTVLDVSREDLDVAAAWTAD